MGFKLKRLKKSLKKTVKSVGKVAIKAVKYGSPIAGTLVGGPLGGAAGTALAGVAATHRAKNKTAAVLRTVKYGGSVALAGGALNVAGGGNFFSSNVLGNTGRLFGLTPAQSRVKTGLDPNEVLLGGESSGMPTKSSTGVLESLSNAFGLGQGDKTADAGRIDVGSVLKESPILNDVAGGADGQFGAGGSGGLATEESGSIFSSPIVWIVGGVVVLFLLYNG